MSENWHEEGDRISACLADLESGKITHFDEEQGGKLPGETTGVTAKRLQRRVVELNSRIGAK